MNQTQTQIVVRVDPGGVSDRGAMLRYSMEQAGLTGWLTLEVAPTVALTALQEQVLSRNGWSDDDLLVFMEGSAHLCVRRFYEAGQFARQLEQGLGPLGADILLSSCVFCHPATAKLVTACDRQFGKQLVNRYPSAEGWVARVGALRRLVRRHGVRSLSDGRWWADVMEVNWSNYGNQPRIAIDHECRFFQPLDEMVRELAPAPFSLLNSRTGEQPMFLQAMGSSVKLGPWMDMLWPSSPGPTWERFLGDYEKQPYDVVLDSGEVLVGLWPNAGTFIDMSGGDRMVASDRVVWMRARELA